MRGKSFIRECIKFASPRVALDRCVELLRSNVSNQARNRASSWGRAVRAFSMSSAVVMPGI
jgi:hypothetical protein